MKKKRLDNILYIVYIHSMKTTMIRKVPDDVHKDFRIMCFEKGVSMNTELLRLMKEAVEKYRKKSK